MKKVTMILAAAALLTFSCSKENEKVMFANQETQIENFIKSQLSSNPEARVVSSNGSNRLVITEGTGEELNEHGTVSFYYTAYVMSGSSISTQNIVATNMADMASAAKWELSDPEAFSIMTINLDDTELIDGLKKGIVGVKGGEECIILFSGEHGFGNKQSGTIPANSALAYHLRIESISND